MFLAIVFVTLGVVLLHSPVNLKKASFLKFFGYFKRLNKGTQKEKQLANIISTQNPFQDTPPFFKKEYFKREIKVGGTCVSNHRKYSCETVTSFVYLLAFFQLKFDVNITGNSSNFDWLKYYDVNQHVSAVATEFSGSMMNLVK